MALPLAGLADALRAAGIRVVELPGWKLRGQTDGGFTPRGVMWHHDASAPGDSPGVPQMMANLANNGAQLWVDRYGTWHMVAAGRMWHAGTGNGWGRIPAGDGNTYSVGIETDHTTGEAWPDVQVVSLRRGTAVLLRYLGASPADALCGHKEYRTTNPDPDGLDMAYERRQVAEVLNNPLEDDDMTPEELLNHPAKVVSPGNPNYFETPQVRTLLGDLRFQMSDTYRAVVFTLVPAIVQIAAAVTEGDLDQEALLARLDTAVREATEQTITGSVLPALKAVLDDALGEDNEQQAEAIVTELSERLRVVA